MNTLNKITDLEGKVAKLEKVTEQSGQMLNEIIQQANLGLNAISQKQDLVVNRIMSIEQSFAAIAKTLNAVVMELEETGKLNSSNVIKKIRTMDENAEKARVQAMIEAGAVVKVDLVGENSMLAVSQVLKKTDGTTEAIADYRVYELNSPLNEKQTIEMFVGKAAGDIVEITNDQGTLYTSILEIYEHQKMTAQAENEAESQGDSDQSPAV